MTIKSLQVECPKCGAKPGEQCKDTVFVGVNATHWVRLKAAKEAKE